MDSMKNINISHTCGYNNFMRIILLLGLILHVGCGGGGGDGNGTVTPSSNNAPVANAGTDLQVKTGTTVQLNGAGSFDPDGDTLTYAWSLQCPATSTTALTSSSSINPTFVPDIDGTYTASLQVHDGTDSSATDQVVITASTRYVNDPPVANAGTDQTLQVGLTALLDGGASSDPNGDILTYAWNMVSRPAGSVATLESPNTVDPSLTPDVEGSYEIELVVNDGEENSPVDTVLITATRANIAPVAVAGPDQTRKIGQWTTFFACDSYDPDGDSINCYYSLDNKPDSSTAFLTQTDADCGRQSMITPDVAGEYIIGLVCNDGIADSNKDAAVLTVVANTPPVANAGSDQAVKVGSIVQLDGTASSDIDGDQISYDWEMIAWPVGNTAALDDDSSPTPTFTPKVTGTYQCALRVTDGSANSAVDQVRITVEPNTPPVADAGTDQTVSFGDSVSIDGSGSYDPDGDTLTYHWDMDLPPGSKLMLFFPIPNYSSDLVFTPDVPGTYKVRLTVNDGIVDSATDTVIITTN